MLPAEVLAQVRRLHLRARKLVQNALGGQYHSAFKGTGLSFEEVREYQPGDDIRSIDWNVTARMGHAFIKRYVEERELTVLLAVDFSASQRFGTQKRTKRTIAAELAALLALCAASNNDRIGLVGFTDRVERFLRPVRGPRHVLRLLRDVLAFEPEHRGTNLAAAFDYINRVQRRRAVVFVLSDFLGLDANAEDSIRHTARQHDLIAIRLADARETHWPAVGLLELEDAETGRTRLVDTNAAAFRTQFAARAKERRDAFAKLMRESQSDLIEAGTDGDHFDALLSFFRRRERRRVHG
jgi:uncharacterized protein (DUF58 family)